MKKSALAILLVTVLAGTANTTCKAAAESFPSGTFIVNMGIEPQTNGNGLKPFGLIYDLIINYQVPVKWCIEPGKVKDGADFTYNSVDYKGGPFIISSDFINATVASRITYWQGQGVQGVYTTTPITIPIHSTITNFPSIMVDTVAGLQAIIENYYVNAGIPPAGYILGAPSGLNECFDIWTNPHGDPVWSTHGYLYNFVVNWKGWIWGQCHAVSMMENVVNPSAPFEQLNFLSQNGLKCWKAGFCGTVAETHGSSPAAPFTNYFPADPEMQFMGDLNLATQAGSEKFFIPLSTGGWNAATKVGVSTSDGIAPQQGVLLVYGSAYGDTTNGRVMYAAGHSLTSGGGGTAQFHKVAAQRTYFNFLILSGKARQLQITATLPPDTATSATSHVVSAQTISGIPPFTYQWSSENGGTFNNANDSVTVYHAPSSTTDTFDIVRLTVTDLCGRVNFIAQRINITGVPLPLPVSLLSFTADPVSDGIQLEWSTATEINNDYFTLFRSQGINDPEPLVIINGAGNSTTIKKYAWMDHQPATGSNFYYLHQTDFDGRQTEYGPVVAFKFDPAKPLSLLQVYPNPSIDGFSIAYQSNNRQATRVEIRDVLGNRVYAETHLAEQGPNNLDLKGSHALKHGIYFLYLIQGALSTQAVKIVKI